MDVAKRRNRRFVTLIEMMIVMFLIALITGVVAYNYRASLDQGKAFKTEQAIERIQTILLLELAENPNADIVGNWQEIVRQSPLAGRSDSLMTDGWGQEYQVEVQIENGRPQVYVRSEAYERHQESN